MFAHVKNYDRYGLVNLLAAYGIREPLLSAFDDVPRELFVEKRNIHAAYEDRALPIAYGQSISQPSVIASSLAALALSGQEKVLEIGTGSGYQTALLSKIAKEVYTIEKIPALTRLAKSRLDNLKIKSVHFMSADGTLGYPDAAPYDAIVVSASYKEVPIALSNQLKNGGHLVMPVGDRDWQRLSLFTKVGDKLELTRKLMAVCFLPLEGKGGWPETRMA